VHTAADGGSPALGDSRFPHRHCHKKVFMTPLFAFFFIS
jgi:hypothetical protein